MTATSKIVLLDLEITEVMADIASDSRCGLSAELAPHIDVYPQCANREVHAVRKTSTPVLETGALENETFPISSKGPRVNEALLRTMNTTVELAVQS